ncbi:RNase A-like domain-containing protein [Actinoplanes sp. NPDC051343]|uniref:RNase A-like domain-containing protein n=1 Tax=Actinoplanes sp. NPDC051343 TaxID=3363906 RepID=UPI0037B030D3
MARKHATSADFELVGMSSDPVPGDPDQIQGVVQRYGDIGDAAEKALNVLRKDGSISTGRGAAMDALRKKVGDDLPDKLSKTARSYQDAADAYRAYIPQLSQAQETFDEAVEQAQGVAAQASQTVPALAADATDDDKAAATKQQNDIDNANSRLSAAKGLAEQAKSMRDAAARTCAEALDHAAGEAIPERNIFQKIADFFADFPFVQILLGALIAIVSVFFPVVGAILGAALFAITQIAAITSGNFKLGDFLVGLVGLIPGASVLKLAGGAFKAGAGVVAKIVPNLAKTAKGSIAGIKASITASKTIGPLTNSVGGKFAGAVVKNFGEGAADEAATEALNGDGLDARQIAGAGAAGILTGGGGGRKKSASSTGPGGIPVKSGQGGTGSRSLPGGTGSAAAPPPSTSNPSPPTPAPALPPPPGTVPTHLGIPLNANGGIDLNAQELQGGHAIARHVGKTPADLDQRLTGTPAAPGVKAVRPIPTASTFNDLTVAERATSDNISANQATIATFLGAPGAPGRGPARITIQNAIPPTDGITRLGPRNINNPTPGTISQIGVSKVTTVLEKDPTAPGGFKIITSYPEP